MKIIESNIIGKKSQKTCEDGLVVTDDFISVIDGSTSKTARHISPDMRNGQYAMLLISEYIRHELKADATVDDFCQGVTAYIHDNVYAPMGIEERLRLHPEERLAASAIIYSRQRREVWMVGDCQAIISGKLYDNPKPYEQEIASKRAALIRQGMQPGKARKAIEPMLIEAMCAGQNKTYAVIDGFHVFRDGVRVIQVESLQKSSTGEDASQQDIILASDGYPFLKPTLADSEEALSYLLANDPLCVCQFVATKGIVESNRSFDDRTYIRFKV